MDALLLLTTTNFDQLDVEIQRTVYREFYQLAFPIVYYRVNDYAAAEDIVQEAFMKIVSNIPVVENATKLRNWIKVVVRNMTYNYLRKTKKDRNLMDVDRVLIDGDPATEEESIETQVEMKAVSDAIAQYLQDMKPEYRILMELRWIRQLSYREIAEALEIHEDTVKYKLHRARNIIKKRFLKEWGDGR